MEVKEYGNGFTSQMDTQQTRSKFGGVMQKMLCHKDGVQVLVKAAGMRRHGDTAVNQHEEESLYEFFASKLGRKLGLNVNIVDLIACGDILGMNKLCSVHTFEAGFVEASDFHSDVAYIASKKPTDVILFDFIIGNGDRHSGNWGYVDGRVFLIDHGYAHMGRPIENRTETEISELGFDKEILNSEVIKKFLTISKEEIYECAYIPEDVEKSLEEYHWWAAHFINRMIDMQVVFNVYVSKLMAKKYHVEKPGNKLKSEPIDIRIVHDERVVAEWQAL